MESRVEGEGCRILEPKPTKEYTANLLLIAQ